MLYILLAYSLITFIVFSETATCPPYRWVSNGFLTYWQSNNTYPNQPQTLITLYCVPGFVNSKPGGVARCSMNGTWVGSVGECVPDPDTPKKPCPPPNPSIAYIAYKPELPGSKNVTYPHGTQAMLMCQTDYYLEVEGNRWKVCNNGKWSGSLGNCKPLG